jgi:glycolate oxidase FAD binding subunit
MTISDNDHTQQLVTLVQSVNREDIPLFICGNNSKSFLGNRFDGQCMSTREHTGIINYEPSELVLTARAGTLLSEVEQLLADNGQMLGFEPSTFNGKATVGGTIACGLSGPRRPFAGSARDFVLGTHLINGKGEVLQFGGEVMKNVAGYDVSRLLAGSYGTLGVLLEVSLKVLPLAETEATRVLTIPADMANKQIATLIEQGRPLSATLYDGERLYLRLSGNEKHVRLAGQQLGGDELPDQAAFWHAVREHQHEFFTSGSDNLWRISLPLHSDRLDLDGDWLSEWAGAQHWLKTGLPVTEVRRQVSAAGGSATIYHGYPGCYERFHPLPDELMQLHRKLKFAFDPTRTLNPGRIYPDL